MASYIESSAPASSTRPASLTAAMGAVILSGVAAIATAVVILAGGLDLVKELGNDLAAKELGVSAAEAQETLTNLGLPMEDLYTEWQSTFQTRAYLMLVLGAAMVVFGLLMRKAATWARVLVTIVAVLTAGFGFVVATDVASTMMLALAWVAVLAGLVGIILTWLPANRRYAKAIG